MWKCEVGKRFPGPVPQNDGATLELTPSGLVCLIQFRRLRPQELAAFKAGVVRYGYLETGSANVPLAMWVFEFAPPFNALDMSFNARPVRLETLEAWMTPENGQIKNSLVFHLLDGPILKANKLFGLEPRLVEAFHETIRKQLNASYSGTEFASVLQAAYSFSTPELLGMAIKP